MTDFGCRPGNDLTYRFPLIVESLARLRSRSCIIDVEAVACDESGVPRFERIRFTADTKPACASMRST
jgi:ATP-dependent DNA ligase